jgi:hypothetical protein
MENNFLNRFTSIYTDKSINGYIRGAAWLGTAAVLYIVGSSIVKAINVAQAQASEKAKQAQLDGDINKLANQGITPTYDASQYNNWADGIQAALTGCDYTMSATLIGILTDAGTSVWNILNQLNNDADFLSLTKAYGSDRVIIKHWYCGYANDVKGGLDATLTQILNPQEISYINSQFAKKGLNSRL